MDVKTCFKCNQEKPLADFYKHKAMSDGHVNKCKECNKVDVRENTLKNQEYYRDYHRKKAMLPKYVQQRKDNAERWKADPELRERKNKLSAQWREKNNVKRSAHLLVQYAVRSKKLAKQPCEICGNKKVDAHHDDYTKPLEVRWLCKKHHSEHHKNERERLRNK